jgi:four helix bundle protein
VRGNEAFQNQKEEFMFNHHRLKCYVRALGAAKRVPTLVKNWPYYLSEQLKRAMASVVLNISEGNGRQGTKDRRRFFNIAAASAKEVASCFDIAYSFGLISKGIYDEMQDELLQIVKMVSSLP